MLRKTVRLWIAGSLGYGVYLALRARRNDDQPVWSPPGWAPVQSTADLDAARAQARSSVTLARANAPRAEAPAPAPIPPSPLAGNGGGAPAAAPTRPPKAPAATRPVSKAPPGGQVWVKAADGVCPESHPIKAKLASKIFHSPGGRNYARTNADRCYADEAGAVADGLRAPQR
jgi:hypothetical protein